MTRFLLALDQGTSSSRALLFTQDARLVGVRQIPIRSRFPSPGWVEQDPDEIWSTLRDAARALIAGACTAEDQVQAVSLSNQRESVVLWDRASLRPLGPSINWRCRRTADAATALSADRRFRQRTGLQPDAYFSGPKIAWLLDHVPAARAASARGDLAAGTVDAWILARLCRGAPHVSDRTNAGRTLCYDIHHDRWDAALCSAQGVPLDVLPEVRPTLGEFGVTTRDAIGVEAPVLAVAGDQQAALFGQGCHGPGRAKCTYGTGAFLLGNLGRQATPPPDGILLTPAAEDGAFALEGGVFTTGAWMGWLAGLGLAPGAAELARLAEGTEDAGGVFVVPALAGLGSPHWSPHARGMIAGLTQAATAAQVARASLEGIAFRVREVLEAFGNRRALGALDELRVDGGAAANDQLLQIQADALQRDVVRPAQIETTALGVALMAGVAAGLWESPSAATDAVWREEWRFRPMRDLEALYNRWRRVREAAEAASFAPSSTATAAAMDDGPGTDP